MKKRLGKLIERRTKALMRGMSRLPIKEKTCWEIAFQIAEVSDEFEFMLSLITRSEQGKQVTLDHIRELYGDVKWHWPMHLRPLTRVLLRALDEMDPEGALSQPDQAKRIRAQAKKPRHRRKTSP